MPAANPISSVNDFVVRFANVNGSGSASANELFARAILRMGVPVSPRNIFPSNIQGLPTWYEVRVSEAGHLGARGGTDMMVAMNPQTWDKDVASIEPGGYLLYDSTKPMPKSKFRDDITVIGVPLTAITNSTYTDPRQRQLFKNIIYLGALSALLDIDPKVIETLIAEQYKGKEKLLSSNVHALHLGRDYALTNLKCPIGLRVQKADKVGDRIFIEGNSAAALGAVYGGATVCAWYPITPSSSLADAFTSHCKRLRHDTETKKAKYAIVQGEDELASIGIVIGAAWNGARAFTATSGPGISLMQEFIGLSYFAEIPAVIMDVQRAGPSTGMPTRTQQCDIISAAYASHGDTKHVLLFPEDPAEAFEMAAQAFDLADRLQTTIFLMLDLDIGMNHRLSRPLKWDDAPHLSGHPSDQGLVLHPRHVARPLRALHRRRPGVPGQHAAAVAQVRDRQGFGAAAAAGQCRQADQVRRDLFRLNLAGHGRGNRRAGSARPPARPAAATRLPIPFQRAELYRRARLRLCRRAEPRQPAALADRQRAQHRSGAAGTDRALRRHADHGALHRQGHRRPSRPAQSDAAAKGCFMTEVAS
jgi:Pyruvate/2-oxoacid:ferredoxin oxidoreductase gamma subunit